MLTHNDEIEVEIVFGDLWIPTSRTWRVNVPGPRLTRGAARDILMEHFYDSGAVWWSEGGYGYRVYPHSVRKLHRQWPR